MFSRMREGDKRTILAPLRTYRVRSLRSMPFEASHEEQNTESCGAESNICLIFVALAVIITANVTKSKQK